LTVDHKPDLPEEKARIEKAGGVVLFDGGWNYRVYAKGKKDSRGKRYPGLNMSRAFGDLGGSNDAGISAVPDVNKRCVSVQPSVIPNIPVLHGMDLDCGDSEKTYDSGKGLSDNSSASNAPSISSFSIDPATDKFVLICSDGVWEFIPSEEAVKTVCGYPPGEAMAAAERLASMAWERWIRELNGQIVDDITALVVNLSAT